MQTAAKLLKKDIQRLYDVDRLVIVNKKPKNCKCERFGSLDLTYKEVYRNTLIKVIKRLDRQLKKQEKVECYIEGNEPYWDQPNSDNWYTWVTLYIK